MGTYPVRSQKGRCLSTICGLSLSMYACFSFVKLANTLCLVDCLLQFGLLQCVIVTLNWDWVLLEGFFRLISLYNIICVRQRNNNMYLLVCWGTTASWYSACHSHSPVAAITEHIRLSYLFVQYIFLIFLSPFLCDTYPIVIHSYCC